MPGTQRRGLSDRLPINEWMRLSNELENLRRRGEAAGREAWDKATRLGKNVAAAQPSDVVRLGAQVLRQQVKAPAAALNSTAQTVKERVRAAAKEAPAQLRQAAKQLRPVGDEAYAVLRGAADAGTLGISDRAWAAGGAVLDAVDGKDLRKAYDDRMAKEHARDKYDAEHHGGARLAGQLGATAVQLVATGGVPGVAKLAGLGGEAVLGLRMKQATPLALREIGTVAGVGAGTGVAGQGVADALSGKVSGLGDYAGAAVGGAVAAPVALKFHGAHAGAAGGAATSLAQDMFNGRIRSADDWVPAIVNAQQAASLGAITGGVATGAAAKRVDDLDRRAKGRLGEDLSELRTAARGEKTVPGGKTREHLSEGWTVPDSRSTDWGGETADIIESKFGRSHKQLKGRQAQAYRELPNYRVDHFLPRDIGAIFGVPAAELAYLTGLNFDRE